MQRQEVSCQGRNYRGKMFFDMEMQRKEGKGRRRNIELDENVVAVYYHSFFPARVSCELDNGAVVPTLSI